MKEIWKDIENYEGYYQISNLGNVRALARKIYKSDGVIQYRKEHLLAKRVSSDGYYLAKFCVNKNEKSIPIHRLVVQTFIPNPDNLPEVNHIDCNRTNNVVTNLEWCTHQDNVTHSAKLGHYSHYGSDNPNYNNHKLHEIYTNNPELAIEKLSRPKGQNGRARAIKLYDSEHNYIATFDWIGGCAEYLISNRYTKSSINSLRSKITNAAKLNKRYLNHYYKFA